MLAINSLMDLACTYAVNRKDAAARELASDALKAAQTLGDTSIQGAIVEFLDALNDSQNRRYVR